MKKIAALFITFIFAGSAFAADIDLGEGCHVQDGFSNVLITSSDGTAIQNAVERIKDGGTIELSGDFKLNKTINIKKNLTIRGVNNAVLERIQAAGTDRVIRCQGNITLENLTITGGYSLNGGGVKLDGGTVKIISCDIYGNTGVLGGGGIHSQAEDFTLTNSKISNNISAFTGGGISAIRGSITMISCDIISNEAQLYGGGVVAVSSTITMNECKITENSASNNGKDKGKGGGVALIKASLTSSDCDISGNTAPQSGDVYYDADSTVQ